MRFSFCALLLATLLAAGVSATEFACIWKGSEVLASCSVDAGAHAQPRLVGAASGVPVVVRGSVWSLWPAAGQHVHLERLVLIPSSRTTVNTSSGGASGGAAVAGGAAAAAPAALPEPWRLDGHPGASLTLLDVQLVLPPAIVEGAIAFFRAQAAADPRTVIWTDNASWLHVNWWSTVGPVSMRGVSLLADSAGEVQQQPSLQQGRPLPPHLHSSAAGAGVALDAEEQALAWAVGVTNETLVPWLLRQGAIATTAPLAVHLASNVSLCLPPGGTIPHNGIYLRRPVHVFGAAATPTSISFCFQANQLQALDPYAALVFDSLILTDLGVGDERSLVGPPLFSLAFSSNLWAVRFNRSEGLRLKLSNTTKMLDDPQDLYYLIYWATAFNSPAGYFHDQSAWMRMKLRLTSIKIRSVNATTIVLDEIRGAATQYVNTVNTVERADDEAAPRARAVVAKPPWLPSLSSATPSPLVVGCSSLADFQEQLAFDAGSLERPYIMLILQALDLRPDPDKAWPPAGGLTVHQRVSMTGGQALPDAAYWDTLPQLHLGGGRALLRVRPDARAAHLQLSGLMLTGLAQGPGAVGAPGEAADVWSVLLWAVDRPPYSSPETVVVRALVMCVTPPEVAALQLRAAASPDFTLVPAGGTSTLSFSGVTSLDTNTLEVGSMHGYGLNATAVRLVAAGHAPCPQTPTSPGEAAAAAYMWPGAEGVAVPETATPPPPLAVVDSYWPTVGAAMGGVVGALLLVGMAMVVLLRRRGHFLLRGGGGDADKQRGSAAGGTSRHREEPHAGGCHVDMPQGSAATAVTATAPASASRAHAAAADDRGCPFRAGRPDDHSPVAQQLSADDSALSSFGRMPITAALWAATRRLQRRSNQLAAPQIGSATTAAPPMPFGDATPLTQRAAGGGGGGGGTRSASSSSASLVGGGVQEIQLNQLLGSGSFSQVYRGSWRGTAVAVKIVRLPSRGDTLSRMEAMAVREVAISRSMSHPNVVQVFHSSIVPVLADPAAAAVCSLDATHPSEERRLAAGSPAVMGWELRLVMELCDQGSLRAALDSGALTNPTTGRPYPATVLALAHDVACAMAHLHSLDVLHLDLKAGNVLLKLLTLAPICKGGGRRATASTGDASGSGSGACVASSSSTTCRLVAKVSDFGLSAPLDPCATHISQMHAGTLTHMAPEILLAGQASKASDVFAFGILMWELATGGRAFAGTQPALLGHQVAAQGRRPLWPADLLIGAGGEEGEGVASAAHEVWRGYHELAEQCWMADPQSRPTFDLVRGALQGLTRKLGQRRSKEGK